MDSNHGAELGKFPPPWNLTGRGYIVLARFDLDFLRTRGFLDPGLAGSLNGRFAWWMYVDYQTADCGPYRELLFIPGTCAFASGRFLTISRIFVSSVESVVNGRKNWGIPKDRCDFSAEYGREGLDRVRLSNGSGEIARLVFKPFGPLLPMIVPLLPRAWVTLGQHHQGNEFIYTPSVSGWFRFARVIEAGCDPAVFPDFARGRVAGCFEVPEFKMTFPISRVHPLDPKRISQPDPQA